MTCKQIQEKLWLGEHTLDVQSHLETCAQCRAEQAMLKELGVAVEKADIPLPTRSLLPSQREIESVIQSHKRRRFRNWITVGAAAAVVVLAVTSVFTLLPSQQGKQQSDHLTVPNPEPTPSVVDPKLSVEEQIKQLLAKYQLQPQSAVLQDSWSVQEITLPSNYRQMPSDSYPNGLFYAYHNVLSKSIGLDMTPYLGKPGYVYIVPVNTVFAGGKFGDQMQNDIVVIVDKSSQRVIGAWQRMLSGEQAASLDNKFFADLTPMSWGEWLAAEQLNIYTDEMKAREPEATIRQYIEALHNSDTVSMMAMTSHSYKLHMLTTAVERNQFQNNSLRMFQVPDPAQIKIEFRETFPLDTTSTDPRLNRKFQELRAYTVTGGPEFDLFTITLVKETPDSPWEVDYFTEGP